MKPHPPSCRIGIALLWLFVVPAQASGPGEVGSAGGWSIIYDPAGEGSCHARQTIGNRTDLAIGKVAPDATWIVTISNPKLQPIQIAGFYGVRYVFGTKYVWSERAVGAADGLRSDDIGDEFVDDFARASSLKLFSAGREVDAMKLLGTRAAIAAVNQCYVFHTRKAAPYAANEPGEIKSSP